LTPQCSVAAGERQSAGPPASILGLAAALAAAPLLQAASLAGIVVLNAAAGRPWSWLAYGLAAPWVAALLWRRHPRARFAAYVFLAHEVLRGLHAGRWDAVAAGALGIGLLQLPAARRWVPSLRPADVLARLGGRRHGPTARR
jgi:hypothetical protein